jgi:hypothetical protein
MAWKQTLWPRIVDTDSSRQAVRTAVKVSTIWAVFSGVFALIALFSGRSVTENPDSTRVLYDGWSLLDASLFGLVAWKIRAMSRGWSIAGLILAALNILLSLTAGQFNPLIFLVYITIIFGFINGVRGTFAYHRWHADEAIRALGLAPPRRPE